MINDIKEPDADTLALTGIPKNFTATLLAYNNYYGYGSLMPGRNYNAPDYRFGFNGMEKDDEMKGTGNSVDFGNRMYDPRLGRTPSPDPLGFAAYPQVTPYSGLNNNPIANIDQDGRLILYFGGYWPGNKDKPAIEYWTDKELLRRTAFKFDDYKAMFFSGHNKLFTPVYRSIIRTPASERITQGFINGEMQAQNIFDALQDQRKTKPNATINSVAHSMGAAYSIGFLQALKNAKDVNGDPLFSDEDFGEAIFFAPYQAGSLTAPTFIKATEFTFQSDLFSSPNIKGAFGIVGGLFLDPSKRFGHNITSFTHRFEPSETGKLPEDITPKKTKDKRTSKKPGSPRFDD